MPRVPPSTPSVPPVPPVPPEWAQVRALFDQLAGLDAAARVAALAASGASAALQQEVCSLLAHADAARTAAAGEGFLATPAAAVPAPAPADSQRSGQRLGAWRIDGLLGRGGMGEVWGARRDDGAYDGRAAIKVLRAGMDSQRVLERFALEQRALARLNHPHIAHLLDAGRTADGLPYIVMEAVQGRPIDLACAGLPLAQRLVLFLQLTDAVAHAHRALLLHRDLKPSNVLVTDAGQVKLLDFGIAKALDPLEGSDGHSTLAGERPFTPHYASPEQVRGEPVGTATDIYSLGVLLYLLLTGQRPYGRSASSAAEAARCVLEEQPLRPSALTASTTGGSGPGLVADPQWLATRRTLQGDLDNVLLKALDKSPAGRYASVDAFAADLRAYLDGFPVSARPAGWGYRTRKFVGRHRLGVALSGLSLATLVGALGLALWQRQEAQAQRLAAEQQRAQAQQRFAQVRQLANQLVFKYHDQIENLPGAGKVREALLTDAAGFMDNLRQGAGVVVGVGAAAGAAVGDAVGDVVGDANDMALAVELAGTYYRISRLQGIDQSVNTGEHAAARANLDKALALTKAYADRPDVPMAALFEAVNMHTSHGEVYQRRGEMARADAALRAGLPLLDKALARDPRDTHALAAAISLHGVHARILGNQLAHANLGRWQDACASADRARAAAAATLAADPANAYAPDSLAFTLGEQAHCRVMAGRPDDALALLEQQQTLRERMVARFPDDQDFRWQGARNQVETALVLSALGRHAAALDRWAAGDRQARAVAAADPGNMAAQRRLRGVALVHARLLAAAGKAALARQAVIRVLGQLPAPPATPGLAFADLQPRADALLWAARLWREVDADRALAWSEEAAASMQPAAHGDDNAARRWLQAQAQGEAAAALAALGRPAEAAQRARDALATWDAVPGLPLPPLLQPARALATRLAAGEA